MKKMKQLLGAVICVMMAASFAYAELPEKPIHVYLQGGGTLPMGHCTGLATQFPKIRGRYPEE